VDGFLQKPTPARASKKRGRVINMIIGLGVMKEPVEAARALVCVSPSKPNFPQQQQSHSTKIAAA